MTSDLVADTKVYCEGQSGGIDAVLLNRLLRPSPRPLEISPIGGKSGWGKFFDAFIKPGTPYLALQDRDLDQRPEIDDVGRPKLQRARPNREEYLTGLPCAESYFLNNDLLLNYLRNNKKLAVSSFQLEEKLRRIAEEMQAYFAVRWAFQDMRKDAGITVGLADISRETLDKDACVQAATEQIEAYRRDMRARLSAVRIVITIRQFEGRFDQYYAHFSSEEFIASKRFVLWFDGKDLLGRWLAGMSNTTNYLMDAVNNLSFKDFPNLLEFRDKCWGLHP
jgi:hypothetical protein